MSLQVAGWGRLCALALSQQQSSARDEAQQLWVRACVGLLLLLPARPRLPLQLGPCVAAGHVYLTELLEHEAMTDQVRARVGTARCHVPV